MPVPQGSGVIHRKSARQAVYETVCDWIITGVMKPGEARELTPAEVAALKKAVEM